MYLLSTSRLSSRLVCAVIAVAALPLSLQAEPTTEADAAFSAGEFEKARELYEGSPNGPEDFAVALRLGEIALLGNRLTDAETHLTKARSLRPDDARPRELLAESYYRRDEFPAAAAKFAELGRSAVADKLMNFGDAKPYFVDAPDFEVHIKFESTDPLPVLQARVNSSDPVYFILDTGGGEIIIDPTYADTLELPRFGSEERTYAGGKSAKNDHSRIESLRFGDWDVKNIPVNLLDTSKFSAAAAGKKISGIVGTVFLSHFIFTLDYPRGELVLRPRSTNVSSAMSRKAAESRAVVQPYWMAGDHFIVTHGRMNGADRRLWFVDTGLAGGAITCPMSTIQDAKVELPAASFEGVGGGGTVKVTPFTVKEFAIGDAKANDLMGFFGPFPEALENRFGFRIAGIVSHGFFRRFALTMDPESMTVSMVNP